jgi:hypothetical protein
MGFWETFFTVLLAHFVYDFISAVYTYNEYD